MLLADRLYQPRPISQKAAARALASQGAVRRCRGWASARERVLLLPDGTDRWQVLYVRWGTGDHMDVKARQRGLTLSAAVERFNACLQRGVDGMTISLA